MEIKQLQVLVAIADHGSFSAAAKALHTVQSNVSAHIARLESTLECVLIDRSTGQLTDEGELVVQRARRIIHEIEDIDGDIHSRGDTVQGECRFGALGTTARWMVPPLLTQLTRRTPGVHTSVVEGVTSTLLPRVLSGEIDAAIVHLPVTEPNLDTTELFTEDLFLLAPAKHPLAERESVTLKELADHPILLGPRGTAQRRIIDRAAANKGVELRSLAEIDGVRLMTSLAFDGYGAAIVPASAVPGWLTGDFVRVSVPDLPRRTVGWVQRDRPRPNRATLAVRDLMLEVIERHGVRQPGITVKSQSGAKGPRSGTRN